MSLRSQTAITERPMQKIAAKPSANRPCITLEIHNSQYPTATVVRLKSEDDGLDYTYIDLLAIVQVIKSESPDVEKGTVKAARKKDSK